MDYNDETETRLVAGEPVVDPQWSDTADFLSELRVAFPPEATAHLEERHLAAVLGEYRPGSATTPEPLAAAPGRANPRLRRVLVTALAAGVAALSLGVNSAAAMGVDPVQGLVQVARSIIPPPPEPALPPSEIKPPTVSPRPSARVKQAGPPTLKPADDHPTTDAPKPPKASASVQPSVSPSTPPPETRPVESDGHHGDDPDSSVSEHRGKGKGGGGKRHGKKSVPMATPTSEET